jgi:hypothetical protein
MVFAMMKPALCGMMMCLFSVQAKTILRWGPTGHTTLADIASVYLTNETAATMDVILGGQSMGDVASWADDIRNDAEWTNSLHFINAMQDPCTSTDGCEFIYERDCVDNICASGAIANYSTILHVLNPKELNTVPANDSAKFIIHFVGDIHQPLHVSRYTDYGGNDIKVKFNDQDWNLHSVWDSGIISKNIYENFGGDSDAFTASLLNQIETTWKGEVESWTECSCDSDGLKQKVQVAPPSVLCCSNAWASESLFDALNYAYLNEFGEEIVSGDTISDEYYSERLPIIQKRLAMGGVRLAALLEAVLSN